MWRAFQPLNEADLWNVVLSLVSTGSGVVTYHLRHDGRMLLHMMMMRVQMLFENYLPSDPYE